MGNALWPDQSCQPRLFAAYYSRNCLKKQEKYWNHKERAPRISGKPHFVIPTEGMPSNTWRQNPARKGKALMIVSRTPRLRSE